MFPLCEIFLIERPFFGSGVVVMNAQKIENGQNVFKMTTTNFLIIQKIETTYVIQNFRIHFLCKKKQKNYLAYTY